MLSDFHFVVPNGPLDPPSLQTFRKHLRGPGSEDLVTSLLEGGLVTERMPARGLAYRVGERSPLTGLVVAIGASTPLLGHEQTVPTAMRRHVRRRSRWRAEARPIVVLADALPRLDGPADELVRFEGRETHAVSSLDGDYVDELIEVALKGTLVVADGHHRLAAARQTSDPNEAILAMLVAPEDMFLGTFHRVFPSAGPLPASGWFDVAPWVGAPSVPPPGALVWWPADGEPVRLVPKVGAGLPTSEVATRLLYPLVGVTEGLARYEADPTTAIERTPAGGAALLLSTPTMSDVFGAARAGELLPPKATRFAPKPLTGLVIRDLSL